jgi:hypothetical protein
MIKTLTQGPEMITHGDRPPISNPIFKKWSKLLNLTKYNQKYCNNYTYCGKIYSGAYVGR